MMTHYLAFHDGKAVPKTACGKDAWRWNWASSVKLATCQACILADEKAALLEACVDAEWTLEGVVEDEELGEECPRLEGFELCGAHCCEHSGCAVERLARVRAVISRARGEAS